ncbi:MAG TPA: BTAD domain-containing putative transcriptional regulator [Thermoanaerobaculia bacterium]|nr:BTAD domain-containing putative transcriptional regulator [Thermoanaerobaculia bacterium]
MVQVWGWPGSGKSPLLQALIERLGAEARGLSLGEVEDPAGLRRSIEEARGQGVRWLVAPGAAEARLAEAARWLHPGERLVFAGERSLGGNDRGNALAVSVVSPQEMLLSPGEVATLWELLTGDVPSPAAARALWMAGDGWYRPLRLAIEATGGGGLEGAAPEDLLDIAPVRFFLRHEVLDSFLEGERPLLDELPVERPADGEEGVEGWRAIDLRGLWVEGEERDRLPILLAAALTRERQRRQARTERTEPRKAPVVEAPSAAREGIPVYSLGLLGSPFARRRDPDGTEIELDCRLKRSFQVLAYLASSPGLEAGREEVMEAVWPTEGERTIERNFHPTLSHLRRALEAGHDQAIPPLLHRKGVYRLNPDLVWEVDALELDRRVEEGRKRLAQGDQAAAADLWEGAWRLYRGPFLQGHYEAWVTERRERYQRLYLELLRDLGDLYLRLERTEQAMDAYRSVLLEDPLQERIHLAVMRLYASQGRRDLVRRQYDRLCSLLLDELGVEPLPQTTREYHRLME